MRTERKIMLMVDHKGVEDAMSAGLDRLEHWQLTGVVRSNHDLQQELGNGEDLPHILMVDAEMEAENDFAATKWAAAEFPQIHVVALADSGDWIYIRRMLECGASGYVLKNSWCEALEYWMEEGGPGSNVEVSFEYSAENGRRKDKKSALNAREIEVLRMLINQYSVREISSELSIGRSDLEAVIDRLYKITKAANPLDLKRYALRHGIY